ncbi:unnamed protein product [Ambrosiozyma monospora]|uniref:Unnamed protein product n=1 Tax=Ambrosiozyma monospora TaxID=43982 RepID=A0A9W6T2T6_AMBMO|nr:unnamed protein product [Ambrosiozyma monospora]
MAAGTNTQTHRTSKRTSRVIFNNTNQAQRSGTKLSHRSKRIAQFKNNSHLKSKSQHNQKFNRRSHNGNGSDDDDDELSTISFGALSTAQRKLDLMNKSKKRGKGFDSDDDDQEEDSDDGPPSESNAGYSDNDDSDDSAKLERQENQQRNISMHQQNKAQNKDHRE